MAPVTVAVIKVTAVVTKILVDPARVVALTGRRIFRIEDPC